MNPLFLDLIQLTVKSHCCLLTLLTHNEIKLVIPFVKTHPKLCVPVVQSHKFSRYRGRLPISRPYRFFRGILARKLDSSWVTNADPYSMITSSLPYFRHVFSIFQVISTSCYRIVITISEASALFLLKCWTLNYKILHKSITATKLCLFSDTNKGGSRVAFEWRVKSGKVVS